MSRRAKIILVIALAFTVLGVVLLLNYLNRPETGVITITTNRDNARIYLLQEDKSLKEIGMGSL